MNNEAKNIFNRHAKLYHIIENLSQRKTRNIRKRLLKNASGKVLEVGAGTGSNFEFYPENVNVYAIDFSEKMLEIARKKALKTKNIIKVELMDIENLHYEDNTFDTIVSFCVFCSVPDPVKGLSEIRRVCKSNGVILMLEHVRSKNSYYGRIMDFLNPITSKVFGDNINRNTYSNFLQAGFSKKSISEVRVWSDIIKMYSITNSK